MAQIYIPPEIWNKILSNVKGTATCERCNEEYCTNCINDNYKTHIECNSCSDILCRRSQLARKCDVCFSSIHMKCDNNLKYRVINDNASFFRHGCVGCMERIKNNVILKHGENNCIFDDIFFNTV